MNYGLKVPVWYSFLINAVTQNNCWLVAKSNFEKAYRVLLNRATLKTAEWNQKTKFVLKCKKMFLFEKIDKNVQFNYLFLRKFLKLLSVSKQGRWLFYQRTGKVVRLKQCPLYGFRFTDAWKGTIYISKGIKCVFPSQKRLRFRAWPIYPGFTGDCLMIVTAV